MRSITCLRSGSGGECIISNIMPPRSKTKKTPPPNKSAKKTLLPNKSAKAPRKDPPAGNQNPVIGTKRKGPNSKTPKPKRAKETSNSEVRPLTTADIPNIIAAVANANHRERPTPVRTSRHTLQSGNRTSQDDPPSGDAQPSSEEEGEEYEDFGKCPRTTRCTIY